MAKDERKILGSVAVDGYNRAFVAGDEDALADAIAEDTDKVIDVEHLTKHGAIVGYGADAPKPDAEPAVVSTRPTKVPKSAQGEKSAQKTRKR